MKPPVYHRMFGYDTALLPNAHLANLERGVSTIEDARTKTGATIGYPGWGIIYHMMLAHLDRSREELIIETGTNQGCTTIVLAQALIDSGCRGKVLTFELDPNNVNTARTNFKAAGVADRVNIHEGDSRVTMSAALNGISKIRFAFLDASHLHDDVMVEFETVLPQLADDALVLFDNTYKISDDGEDPRVNGALKTIMARYGGNLINLEYVSWFTPGLAIWQKRPNL